MRQLYKIIIFFILIFLIGIYVAVKSIDASFSDEVNTEVVSMNPSFINLKVATLSTSIYITLFSFINFKK